MTNRNKSHEEISVKEREFEAHDDTDADAFATLCLLIIMAASFVYYLNG